MTSRLAFFLLIGILFLLAGPARSQCSSTFLDCNDDQTCETDILTDLDHCGSCANACPQLVGHAQGLTCTSGKCGYSSCDAGYMDCDADPTNGCETQKSCIALPNYQPATCSAGKCSYLCNPGHLDCDTTPPNSDGCETTASVKNCGACGLDCDTLPAVVIGSTSCVNDKCQITCKPNFGDCDNFALTGCEIPLLLNVGHCGACGNNCTLLPNIKTAGCASGKCAITCQTNWGDCNASPDDGCEVDLLTSTSHCNVCGKDCSAVKNVDTTSCVNGQCTYGKCLTNYDDCDANKANGCETDLTTLATCGSCKVNCDAVVNVKTKLCTAGKCSYDECLPNFVDVDGNELNGCEYEMVGDPAQVPGDKCKISTCATCLGKTGCCWNGYMCYDGLLAHETTCPSSSCTVTNVCYTGGYTCPANSYCHFTGDKTYDCRCNAGFKMVDGTCKDIDECAENAANCDQAPRGTCTNTVGSFTCGCGSGYQPVPGSTKCVTPSSLCGNGRRDSGEDCDNGTDPVISAPQRACVNCKCDAQLGFIAGSGTSTTCVPSLSVKYCGDGERSTGEECEVGYPGCSESCLCLAGYAAAPVGLSCVETGSKCGNGL